MVGCLAFDSITSVHGSVSRGDVASDGWGGAAGDLIEVVSAASVVKAGADVMTLCCEHL